MEIAETVAELFGYFNCILSAGSFCDSRISLALYFFELVKRRVVTCLVMSGVWF